MFSVITGGLKLLGKTKLGKKVAGKVKGVVGNIFKGKLGKKGAAGSQTTTSSPQMAAVDRAIMEGANKGNKMTLAPEDKDAHPVSDTIGDFIGRIKDKAGPIETTVGADKTFMYVGLGAAVLIVVAAVAFGGRR